MLGMMVGSRVGLSWTGRSWDWIVEQNTLDFVPHLKGEMEELSCGWKGPELIGPLLTGLNNWSPFSVWNWNPINQGSPPRIS